MTEPSSFLAFRHLRYFLASADYGSFRKAGVALGVQESAISRRIRDLEDQLGASLFHRYNGGVRLTIAGEKLLARARTIVRQMSDGVADVSLIGSGMDGRIRIGLIASIATGFPAHLLRNFSQCHRSVHIELVDGDPVARVAALRCFDLDIAFLIGTQLWPGCDAAALWSERVFALLSEGYPLAARTELAWSDMVRETFITAETATGKELQALMTTRLAALGYVPIIQSHKVGSDTLLPLVSLGRGLLLATGIIVEGHYPGIVHRPISGEVITFRGVWSPNNDNPAFRRFLSMAKASSSRCAK